jgi:hypothetical protein
MKDRDPNLENIFKEWLNMAMLSGGKLTYEKWCEKHCEPEKRNIAIRFKNERRLTYSERWELAYDISFNEWQDNNWKKGNVIIPSCGLEDVWDKLKIPKYLDEVKEYKRKKKTTPTGIIFKIKQKLSGSSVVK